MRPTGARASPANQVSGGGARSKSLVMGEQHGLPFRPCPPCPQERVLKCGWLKKQRSLMKNWQQRWFVLRGEQLLYYKDEEEAKPQGFISLQGGQVHEVAPNSEEPGKHLFEIEPGGTGDHDKMPFGQEAFLLMASSQNEMEDWVKAIQRVIGTPICRGIFGQRLEDTIEYEKKYGRHLAPLLVEQCADFIREHGLSEEGLFRMPGQANLVKDLQDSFDCGEKPHLDRNTDVHTVASVLKLYLRELPEPVVPFARYEDFLSCGQLLSKDRGEGTQELARQVKNLPQANYNLLKYICKFLDEVQSHSSFNKMSVQNLATVFGPNILRPPIEDPVTIMEGTSHIQHLMTVLISEHQQIFGASSAEGSGVPADPPASDWVSKEGRGGGQWENHISGPVCLSSMGTPSSVQPSTQEPLSQGSHSPAAASPGTRRQTLSTGRHFFRQPGNPSLSPKEGSSSVDSPSLPSNGNWLRNGLYPLQSHRRAPSRGRIRDSSSSHRLSTYDNVPAANLPLNIGASGEGSLAGESVSSCAACRASDSSALSFLQMEWAARSSLPHSVGYLETSTEWSDARFSSSSSEPKSLAAASRDSVACSGALQSLVVELKAELSKQKIEYEASIRRIEETSTELRKLVVKLEEELDQEKKKYMMLEIKLRNSERACEDAGKRNQLLQKEMEDFFATLANLTTESPAAKAPK
ncbi:rho GTPase-activating protein 22 [Eublepharis macularius]|uniref:Rho GTPase-activating protein 24 n=1 Tax=Eublepharis macularius TaxID=481883 RepID=A0AA97L2R0_EUBMA|nr:rho GTPase-activating protein 22 [Eublepharis macularius]